MSSSATQGCSGRVARVGVACGSRCKARKCVFFFSLAMYEVWYGMDGMALHTRDGLSVTRSFLPFLISPVPASLTPLKLNVRLLSIHVRYGCSPLLLHSTSNHKELNFHPLASTAAAQPAAARFQRDATWRRGLQRLDQQTAPTLGAQSWSDGEEVRNRDWSLGREFPISRGAGRVQPTFLPGDVGGTYILPLVGDGCHQNGATPSVVCPAVPAYAGSDSRQPL